MCKQASLGEEKMDNHLTNQERTGNERRAAFIRRQAHWVEFNSSVVKYMSADNMEAGALRREVEGFMLDAQRLIFFLNYLEEQGHIELWNKYLDADLQRGSYYSVSPIPEHLSQEFEEWRVFRERAKQC
jgi:hypothetical protein